MKNILQLLIFGIERCYLQKMINSLKGQAIDLDYDGYLIVRDEAGESHRLISADIDF